MSASPPTFSIVMAAYRSERYVAEAVESVIAQDRGDWELIVVDDGSPDRLAERIRPYLRDPRIRLKCLPRNRGVSNARNVGAELAEGRYVTVFDSDDLLDPDYLSLVAAEFEREPALALVGFRARCVDDSGARRPNPVEDDAELPRTMDPRQVLTFLLRKPFVFHGATFRREVFHAIGGYDPSFSIGEDFEIWSRLAHLGHRISILPAMPYRYRQSPESALRGAPRARTVNEQWLRLFLHLSATYTSRHHSRALGRRIRAARWIIARLDTRESLDNGQWRAARRAALVATRQRPTGRTVATLAATMLPAAVLSRLRGVTGPGRDPRARV